jgi:hypothetical protein
MIQLNFHFLNKVIQKDRSGQIYQRCPKVLVINNVAGKKNIMKASQSGKKKPSSDNKSASKITTLEDQITQKNQIIQGLRNEVEKLKLAATITERPDVTKCNELKAEAAQTKEELAVLTNKHTEVSKEFQTTKDQMVQLDQEMQHLKTLNEELSKTATELQKKYAVKMEQNHTLEDKYHELVKEIEAFGISETDLDQIPKIREPAQKTDETNHMSSSLFTIRIYKRLEGLTGIIHHPYSRDKLNFRGPDGHAISAFIKRHFSWPIEQETYAQAKTGTVPTEKHQKVLELKNKETLDTLSLVFVQSDKSKTDPALEARQAFSIEANINIPELLSQSAISEHLSFCSLWIGIRRFKKGGYLLQESHSIKLHPKTANFSCRTVFQGLEAGKYFLMYRFNIPLYSRMISKSIQISMM